MSDESKIFRVINKRSLDARKKPSHDQLEYGEIAVNYNEEAPFIVYVVERQHATVLCVDFRTLIRPCFRVEIVIALSEVERRVKDRRYAYYDKVQRAENLALHGMPVKFMSHGNLAFCHSL